MRWGVTQARACNRATSISRGTACAGSLKRSWHALACPFDDNRSSAAVRSRLSQHASSGLREPSGGLAIARPPSHATSAPPPNACVRSASWLPAWRHSPRSALLGSGWRVAFRYTATISASPSAGAASRSGWSRWSVTTEAQSREGAREAIASTKASTFHEVSAWGVGEGEG